MKEVSWEFILIYVCMYLIVCTVCMYDLFLKSDKPECMYVLTLVRMNVCVLTSALNQIVFTIATNTSIHTVHTYIQSMRTLAMWHCGRNFSHRIVERKPADHLLVTDGVYRLAADGIVRSGLNVIIA